MGGGGGGSNIAKSAFPNIKSPHNPINNDMHVACNSVKHLPPKLDSELQHIQFLLQ